ncbi:hypothetical protein Godav_000033 [Gossypium davidsonii]|uniref:Uncharacterized protein n=1 Tax=Gossypium davidsonii TaxID=34287 RepID=A0A7J8TGT5_GOSDV|nr:hypothetical protein [Gossypium davidsonii]
MIRTQLNINVPLIVSTLL